MNKLVRFDWAIKDLLRNKANFDILEGFLSELLKTDIKIECILESESNKQTATDKYNHVDLLALTEKKERIIIEVQTASEWDYLSRVLYGTSRVVTEHLRQGEEYKNICKVISVSVVFFDLGHGQDYLYKGTTEFKGIHCHDILKLGPNEQKVYGPEKNVCDLFPEYYIIKVNQFNERIKDKFDEWVFFLKNEQIKSTFNAKGIASAAQKLDVLRLNEQERHDYERYQKMLHHEASMIFSHYGMGKLDGKKEALFEVARSLKKNGFSLEEIHFHTGIQDKDLKDL